MAKKDGISQFDEKKNKKGIFSWFEALTLLLALFSIWLTFYLSSPIDLKIWENISQDGTRLDIYAHNNDFRSTGTIDIYRIEVNPDKPHIQLEGNDTLKGLETKRIASLIIKINESKEIIISNDIWQRFTIPTSLIFYITEDTSISYRVMCDNCKQYGIVRRIPNTGVMTPRIILDPKKNQVRLSIPIYAWETRKLEDLYKMFPSN